MNIYSEEHLNYFLKTLEITYDVRINILKKTATSYKMDE